MRDAAEGNLRAGGDCKNACYEYSLATGDCHARPMYCLYPSCLEGSRIHS